MWWFSALGNAAWRHQYPYGFSHCCDLQLYQGLAEYARTHGGAFPAGEATPEASLSLLYREKAEWGGPLADAESTARQDRARVRGQGDSRSGKLLAPETCGWHYVEGLRLDDDRRLALFWDKAGLDHNGGRMPQGGHIVIFVNGLQGDYRRDEVGEFSRRAAHAARETSHCNPSRCNHSDRQPRGQGTGPCGGRLHLWLDLGFERH